MEFANRTSVGPPIASQWMLLTAKSTLSPNHNTQFGPGGRVDVSLVPTKRVEPAIGKAWAPGWPEIPPAADPAAMSARRSVMDRNHTLINHTISKRRRRCGWLVGLVAATALAGCAGDSAIRHQFMQGQVLSVDANEIVVCIGKRDGAHDGQVLNVIRHLAEIAVVEGAPFSRAQVGQVRIVDVYDDHYAHASIVTGEAKTGDMVELDN